MKKVWVSLLTILLACALLTSAVFAEGEGFGAESWEYSEQVETVVEEVEEFELGEDAAMVYDDAELTDEADDEAAFEEATDAVPEETADSEPEPVPVVEEMTDAVDAALASNNSQPSENFVIEDGVLIQYVGPGGAVVIPSTVKTIGTCAFMRCDSEGNAIANTTLTSVTIPDSVTVIEGNAFQECTKLTRVIISGDNLWRVEDAAFWGCSSLTSIVIPECVYTIGKGTFFGCSSLQTVKLPAYLEEIPYCLFWGCSSLKTISIPKSVKRIGWSAFEGCKSLSSITIPDGVAEICGMAFAGCSSLVTITIPGSVKRFVVRDDNGEDQAIFWKSGLRSAIFKDGVTEIPRSMFYDCANLTGVGFPASLTAIQDYAFANCTGLKSMIIPKTVTSIADTAFNGHASGFKIMATCNSAAHKYAKARGICGTISGHTSVSIPAVAATCTQTGLTQGSKCSVCGEILTAQKTVAALGHKTVNTTGKAATCTATGLTQGTRCILCGEWIKPQATIPATGHKPATVKGYAATYTSAGLSDGAKCSVCGTWTKAQTAIPRKVYPGSVLAKKGKNGTITVNIGERFYLTPQFAANANTTVKGYKSSKKSIAAVDGNGLVTPKKAGKATITVTTNDKKKKATVVVKVVDPYKPTGISITNGKKVTLEMGKTLKLGAKMKPDTAQSNLTWKSSKKSVATVDGSGLVTPHKEGTAKITVTTRNKKKATITVKVVDPTKPTGISITNGKTVTLKVGETLKLGAKLKPDTAQSELTWKSSNKKIATVDATGTVKALKKGKVKITVTTKKNKKKATITVKVVP